MSQSGQFLPLAMGSFRASDLPLLESRASSRYSPEGGRTEVGTRR